MRKRRYGIYAALLALPVLSACGSDKPAEPAVTQAQLSKALQDVADVPGISEQMTEKWAGLAQTGTPAEKAP